MNRGADMRIVNWNIEWMNHWFVGGNQAAFRNKNTKTGITDVDDLCKRIAGVIKGLDPDVLTVEEGPSDMREMRLFANEYLSDGQGNTRFDIFGGIDGGAQKLYTLVKKKGAFKNPKIANDSSTKALKKKWQADVDGDYRLKGYKFTRLPLVVEGRMGAQGPKLRIVSLHTKSKYVQKGKSLWEKPSTRRKFIVAAMKNRKNRRRIASEAMRVREYLDSLVDKDNGSLIVVTGDFNDGPGIDYFEKNFLAHNVTDILLGSTYYPNRLFKHAFLERVPEDQRYTVIFDDFIDDVKGRHILLDHILVSPGLSPGVNNAGIAHQEFDAGTDNNARGRQRYVSDHRPVYVDL